MIYILLSVVFNTILFIVLKSYSRFKIDTLQALVVNYGIAFLMGLFMNDEPFQYNEITQKSWYFGSLMLGFLFISVFYVTAITSQRNGISVASVASKMSVIIPVVFGILLYEEPFGFLKITGILLALTAVYFTSKKEEGAVQDSRNMLFPALVFLGAGAIDTILKVIQNYYLDIREIPLFSSHTFLMAFCVGIMLITYRFFRFNVKPEGKNVLGGIVLGIPNYFSLYYIVRMLSHESWDSSTIFTVHNVAIVMLSTLAGVLIFREKISWRNALGILLALIAIGLVTT